MNPYPYSEDALVQQTTAEYLEQQLGWEYPHLYTEDTLVQQTTADYLEQQLGWESVYAHNNEDFGPDSLLGRASNREKHKLTKGDIT
jgi:hypothetical protein